MLNFKKTQQMLKENAGAALMMAIFAVTMLMVIATEVVYQTSVEYIVSSQAVNQVKAYYAAKAGVEISLLRIHIYRKAAALIDSLGDQAKDVPKSMLDPIWQFPFSWPPAVPEEASGVDKDAIKSAVKSSNMQAQYLATIESEGSKIDLNDLASSSEVVAESTKQQILQLFNAKLESDEAFSERFRGFDFQKLVNNIADWVDEDKESRNGGDESAFYPAEENSDFVPANQPFKTIQELHLVADMTDDLYDVLAPRVTVFGVKGINVNYASKDVLMSLSPQITAERADQIIEARNNPQRGLFKDEKDFVGFLGTLGINGNPFRDEEEKVKVPLLFDAEYNFRIRSTGRSGQVTRDIVAVVYDFDRVKERLKELGPTSSPTPAPGTTAPPAPPTPTPTPAKKQPTKVPNERPQVVYWNES